MIVAFIDTSSHEKITVSLQIDGNEWTKVDQAKSRKAQVVLPLLMELLKEQGKTLQNITAVEVATGPGSFTGLRVGVAIANTLGTVLGVPINGKNVGELAEPIYE